MNNLLVEVYRDSHVESKHNGTIVVVNDRGETIGYVGDPKREIFARSSMKLFQVIPAIEAGVIEKYSLSSNDISLFCASHSGEEIHTSAVQRNLQKASLTISALKCGTHPPLHVPTYEQKLKRGQTFSPIHNNCSGKHTGMLLTAMVQNEETETYYQIGHPVQQRILQAISQICEYPAELIQIGVDGCGVPVHRIPMYNIALGYANFAAAEKFDEPRKKAIRTMVQSIIEAPEMIGGTNRFCTDLIRVCNGKLIAKSGAEGVYCVGHLEKKLGIVVKIDDGNPRASYPSVMEVLRQLALITDEEYEQLKNYAQPDVLNVRGEVVGKVRVHFTLKSEN